MSPNMVYSLYYVESFGEGLLSCTCSSQDQPLYCNRVSRVITLPIHRAYSYWQCCLERLCLCHQNCPFPFKLFFHPLLLLIHFLKMGQPWEKFKYLPLNTSFFSYLYKAMEEISRFPLAEMPHFHSRLWPANPLHQIEVELSGVTWRNISIHGLRRVLYASRYHFYKCY